jgi:hypothetical protein
MNKTLNEYLKLLVMINIWFSDCITKCITVTVSGVKEDFLLIQYFFILMF